MYSNQLRNTLLALASVTTLVANASFAQQTNDAQHAAAVKAAVQDPLLNAMQQELDRERDLLKLPGLESPYFIEYRLDDYSAYEAVATFGALTREERQHQRIVRVTVRVGDYTSDSSSSRGDGSVELAPEDNDPAALRYALWTTTDDAYKAALRGYSTKQAALKRFEKPPTEKDFAAAPAAIAIEPTLKLQLDEAEWKRRIIDASGVFLNEPSLSATAKDVQFSSASVRGVVLNRWIVNSEGTVVRHGTSGYSANYSVNGQAEDGMRLGRDNGSTAAQASELESAAAFHQRAVKDVQSYEELRHAPLADAEDFHGPVLFSGDAASEILDRLFVPNVLAERPEMGTTARTTGVYNSSLHARVLSDLIDVIDDPRMATFNGHSLVGAYRVDDEGVPAKAVDVVEHGKLMNYLTSRTPIRDFATSDGHGRSGPGGPAHSAAGVLVFKPATPTPIAELHARLIAMAKKQGSDVYEVETMGGDSAPRLLYRVHPDGTRQLVRGAIFDELDNRSLRTEILAAGDDPYINNTLGNIPMTTIAPSLLLGDIGVKRATEEQQKLPYYAPPVKN